jgi:MFS family permease
VSRRVVAATVFGAAAAVLTLEILAVRLLAPYVGLTIETYTAIIGVALAGIAAGAAVGGRLADQVDPVRLIGALLAVGGVLAMLTVPVVDWLGDGAGASTADALVLAVLTLGPPAAVLSGVTPAAAKLEVGDLGRTGSEVGRISAWATAGALLGTFATGFVLVPLLSTRVSVLAVGGLCVLAGVALGVRHRLAAGGAALCAAAIGLAAGSPCDRDSAYFCARVDEDPARASGRVLTLDDLRHSYVDLRDPRHLEFPYTRWIGDVIDAAEPDDAVFVGGGGFTLPRYLLAVRPAARATVLELDPELVALARDELGLRESARLRVRVGDARVRMRELPAASADLVVGDAFGSRSIPWHLATREFVQEIRRVLRPGGIYAVNLIDHGPLNLARAEAATLRREFDHVGIVSDEHLGGNLVLVASDRALPAGITHDERFVAGFAGEAEPLTDDRGPAEQLLTPTA